MQTQYEIAVIGSGNAAEGVVHGFLLRSVLLNHRILACRPTQARRGPFRTDGEATQGDLFVAIDPGAVADPEAFLDRVEDLKADVRASRTAPGVARIYLPGEPEMECRSNRLEEGIPIETDLLRELETLAGEAAA